MDSRYFATFTADDGTSVSVLLNAPSPKITDGYGGWETVDRPRRTGLVRFKGANPVRQDLAIIFDGARNNASQEAAITDLESMAQSSDLSEPSKVTLDGLVLRKDLTWVIDSIDWDDQNTMWITQGGFPVRVRQAAVVHLLEFVDDSVIATAPTPAVAANPTGGKTTTTPQGMTLRQIAALEYGDPTKWGLILLANPWLTILDPRQVIAPGTRLWIPDPKTNNLTSQFVTP